MLNVKSKTFNPFEAEKLKKAGIFTKVARKIELASICFCNLVSRY